MREVIHKSFKDKSHEVSTWFRNTKANMLSKAAEKHELFFWTVSNFIYGGKVA